MSDFYIYSWKNDDGSNKNYGYTEYFQSAEKIRAILQTHSPSLCLAKWLQVSINLTNGSTQSCYHPPPHNIPMRELRVDVSALHNTDHKKHERRLMLRGERPEGCAYCWRVEDAGDGNHLSDRHYKSGEHWARDKVSDIVTHGPEHNVIPTYVEVNFNRTCNFKCMYCSPHVSSTWQEEIENYGPYDLKDYSHNDLIGLQRYGYMPLSVSSKDNPYVEAFWKWWPEIYYELRVFRMTGGEPLMDRNTFKVLDYVVKNPHSKLELSITSNLCPPDQKLFDKFLDQVKQMESISIHKQSKHLFPKWDKDFWYVEKGFKNFWLYVSLDSVGDQAEYIRHGMDFKRLKNNVEQFLTETKHTMVSFINTFNILSIHGLKDFLQMILDLRQKYGGQHQVEEHLPVNFEHEIYHLKPKYYPHKKFQRIHFDIPLLDYPHWFDPRSADQELVDIIEDCVKFMEDNQQKVDYLITFEGFKPHEILKLKRNLEIIKKGISAEDERRNRLHFFEFIIEYDRRKKLSFPKVFPKMRNYFMECEKIYREENAKR